MLKTIFSVLDGVNELWLSSKMGVAQVKLEISVPIVQQIMKSQRITLPELLGGIGMETM